MAHTPTYVRAARCERMQITLSPELAQRLWKAAKANWLQPEDQVRLVLRYTVKPRATDPAHYQVATKRGEQLWAYTADVREPRSMELDAGGNVRLIVMCTTTEQAMVFATMRRGQWDSPGELIVSLLNRKLPVSE